LKSLGLNLLLSVAVLDILTFCCDEPVTGGGLTRDFSSWFRVAMSALFPVLICVVLQIAALGKTSRCARSSRPLAQRVGAKVLGSEMG